MFGLGRMLSFGRMSGLLSHVQSPRCKLIATRRRNQCGVTIKVVSQSRWCHSQCGVTVEVVSQSTWCHSQCGVTVEVVTPSKWRHCRSGVTANVMSRSMWCHSQCGVIAEVVPQSTWCRIHGGVTWCHLHTLEHVPCRRRSVRLVNACPVDKHLPVDEHSSRR